MNSHAEQMSLPLTGGLIEVHCFFSTFPPKCSYVAKSADPQEAHDLMEMHYAQKHLQQIDRICARFGNKKETSS